MGSQVLLHRVAASSTEGCSLQHRGLQPPSIRLGLQPPSNYRLGLQAGVAGLQLGDDASGLERDASQHAAARR
eukprot:scaffold67180_cov33-Phaeocystis_antarctica.AAC.2